MDVSFELMKSERERLKTFVYVWPLYSPSPRELARDGLFYLGDADKVQCAFCRAVLFSWNVDDIPSNEHCKLSPFCPFVLSLTTGNIPITMSEHNQFTCSKIYNWHYFLKIDDDYYLHSESVRPFDNFNECVRNAKSQCVPSRAKLFFSEESGPEVIEPSFQVHYFANFPNTTERVLYYTDDSIYHGLEETRKSVDKLDICDCQNLKKYFCFTENDARDTGNCRDKNEQESNVNRQGKLSCC